MKINVLIFYQSSNVVREKCVTEKQGIISAEGLFYI